MEFEVGPNAPSAELPAHGASARGPPRAGASPQRALLLQRSPRRGRRGAAGGRGGGPEGAPRRGVAGTGRCKKSATQKQICRDSFHTMTPRPDVGNAPADRTVGQRSGPPGALEGVGGPCEAWRASEGEAGAPGWGAVGWVGNLRVGETSRVTSILYLSPAT